MTTTTTIIISIIICVQKGSCAAPGCCCCCYYYYYARVRHLAAAAAAATNTTTRLVCGTWLRHLRAVVVAGGGIEHVGQEEEVLSNLGHKHTRYSLPHERAPRSHTHMLVAASRTRTCGTYTYVTCCLTWVTYGRGDAEKDGKCAAGFDLSFHTRMLSCV